MLSIIQDLDLRLKHVEQMLGIRVPSQSLFTCPRPEPDHSQSISAPTVPINATSAATDGWNVCIFTTTLFYTSDRPVPDNHSSISTLLVTFVSHSNCSNATNTATDGWSVCTYTTTLFYISDSPVPDNHSSISTLLVTFVSHSNCSNATNTATGWNLCTYTTTLFYTTLFYTTSD
eukprot:Em0007g1191a